MPVNILSKKGFSKKIFVTKGACRELMLFKTPKRLSSQQFRSKIKQMTLIYIYNQGTFLNSVEFDTQYDDVKFLVE